MIPKQFDQIATADIEALVTNGRCERRTLEYKKILPGNADGDKKEFLADVVSFANAAGGDILYGVDANDGVPTKANGLANLVVDATILQLENMIRDGASPRISGVQIRAIEGFSAGPVLVVRIPKSWAAPHMVTFKGASRFFVRNNAGKHQMDIGEIRSGFALSEALPEKISRFRADRLAKIMANAAPVQLADGPRFVLHIFPLVSFSTDSRLDAGAIRREQPAFCPMSGGWDNRYNIDGLIAVGDCRDGERGSTGYCQVFRSGIIESVTVEAVSKDKARKVIPGTNLEMELMRIVRSYLTGLKNLDVPNPAIVTAAFLGIAGYELAVPFSFSGPDHPTIDRDELILPDILIEDFAGDMKLLLRPLFDALWNAGGYESCMNYDSAGNWTASH